MEKLEKQAKQLLKNNRREKDGFVYTVPSPTHYPYQWLWDSCFHAIVLAKFDTEAAKNELRSLVSAQFDDGMIPHMIYWEKGELHNYNWGKDGTSSITQPPMVAYAVREILKHDDDTDFLAKIYPALHRFYHYLVTKRDPRGHHLIGIINPDESGEDNSPRFDELLGLPPQHSLEEHLERRLGLVDKNRTCDFDAETCMKQHFWVKDVPFNVIVAHNLRIFATFAAKLGKDDDERYFNLHAQLITEELQERCYDGTLYYSTEGAEYRQIKVKTWAVFMPLFAGIPEVDEARELVDAYLFNEDEFGGPYSIPTVSRSEESYNPEGFWRGPVWIAPNWFVYKGLKRYGFDKEAARIKEKSIELIKKSGFREYYNPDTGEGLGAEEFTWGTLVIDMD